MAITKTGQTVLIKEAVNLTQLFKNIPKDLWNMAKPLRILAKPREQRGLAGRAVAGAFDKGVEATKAVSGATLKGLAATARHTVDRPGYMLPLLAAGGYGAYNLPREAKKTILHANPNYDVTSARGARTLGAKLPVVSHGFRDIKYKSPEAEQYYSKKNIYY